MTNLEYYWKDSDSAEAAHDAAWCDYCKIFEGKWPFVAGNPPICVPEKEARREFAKWLFENNIGGEVLLAHTPIFDLVKMPEVEVGFCPVKIKSKDWVTVIVEQNHKFLTVSQLRYGVNKKMVEFPCGMVERGELPSMAALRELEEETGITVDPDKIKYLGSVYANPAFMTNKMHYFYIDLNRVNYVTKNQHLDEHEHIDVKWVDAYKFVEECENGSPVELVSSLMFGAIYFYNKLKREKLKAKSVTVNEMLRQISKALEKREVSDIRFDV